MILLGIDTSATTCTAALVRDQKVLGAFSRRDGMTHSETLLPGVLSLLKGAALDVGRLDAIAVSAGPGSFTGLRIGIATAKGLAYDRDLPCVPVSTLEALAENASDRAGSLVCAVMDARRGEFYNALFNVTESGVERLTEDRAVSGQALYEELSGEKNTLILGDGAEKFVGAFPELAPFLAPEDIRWQSGVSVCRVAQRRFDTDKTTCRMLSPRYLRLPQAEREWLRRQEENHQESEQTGEKK